MQLFCTYCDKYFDTNEQDHARYQYPMPIMCETCVDNEEHEEKQRQDWAAMDMDEPYIEEQSCQ